MDENVTELEILNLGRPPSVVSQLNPDYIIIEGHSALGTVIAVELALWGAGKVLTFQMEGSRAGLSITNDAESEKVLISPRNI